MKLAITILTALAVTACGDFEQAPTNNRARLTVQEDGKVVCVDYRLLSECDQLLLAIEGKNGLDGSDGSDGVDCIVKTLDRRCSLIVCGSSMSQICAPGGNPHDDDDKDPNCDKGEKTGNPHCEEN